MADRNPKSASLHGLKPVVIMAVAVAFFLKSQKAMAIETQEGSTETPFCPAFKRMISNISSRLLQLAPDRASRGKAPFRMWYYDVTEGECRRFRWSGRGGNKNRFMKKADCEEICSKCTLKDSFLDEYENQRRTAEVSLNDSICSRPIDDGRCEVESQPQLLWHFNKEKAKCSPFIFYGCGGSPNRFKTKDDCEELCH